MPFIWPECLHDVDTSARIDRRLTTTLMGGNGVCYITATHSTLMSLINAHGSLLACIFGHKKRNALVLVLACRRVFMHVLYCMNDFLYGASRSVRTKTRR